MHGHCFPPCKIAAPTNRESKHRLTRKKENAICNVFLVDSMYFLVPVQIIITNNAQLLADFQNVQTFLFV